MVQSTVLEILFEGTGRDSHGKGKSQSERQDDPGRVQTERQCQVKHPDHDDQWHGSFLGVVIDERVFPAATPTPQIPPHQSIHQSHQGKQSKYRRGQSQDSESYRKDLSDLHTSQDIVSYGPVKPVQYRAHAGLFNGRTWRDPLDEIDNTGALKGDVVEAFRQITGSHTEFLTPLLWRRLRHGQGAGRLRLRRFPGQ